MKYNDFIKDISKQTGLSPVLCREVILAMSVSLTKILKDEKLFTPLGTFSWRHLLGKKIKMPKGKSGEVKEQLKLKLKPNKSFTIKRSNPLWDFIVE